MSRSPQTLAPVQPRPSFWTRVIALFARLWRIIWWVWSTVFVGGLLVSIIISLATNGTSGLTDPRTWVVIQPLLAHPLLTIIALIAASILTLCAFLAYPHEKRVARTEQQAHDKALVVVAEGVRDVGQGVLTALEELKARPAASPPPPSNVVPPPQEIPPTTTWNVPFRSP